MLSTITESTESRPLTADEIDFVAGGTTTIRVRGKLDGTPFASTNPNGNQSASNASVSWSVTTGPGSISETSTVTATNGGSASLILTTTST